MAPTPRVLVVDDDEALRSVYSRVLTKEGYTVHMYPTYTFFDLLLSENQLLTKETPKVDPSIFRDKLVFVGTTASGLLDTFESPFGHGKMPGIQIHAAVADDILSNRFIHPASEWVRAASVVAGALVVGMTGVAFNSRRKPS